MTHTSNIEWVLIQGAVSAALVAAILIAWIWWKFGRDKGPPPPPPSAALTPTPFVSVYFCGFHKPEGAPE